MSTSTVTSREAEQARKRPEQSCVLTVNGGSSSLKFALFARPSSNSSLPSRVLAGRIERKSRCILENARTGFFGERRESKRIVKWINVKGFPVMHRAEIPGAVKLIAHAVRRPELDVGTDPAHAFNFTAKFAGIVGFTTRGDDQSAAQ